MVRSWRRSWDASCRSRAARPGATGRPPPGADPATPGDVLVGWASMASTIYDVAALAGVSPATVSRVLNGSAVSPEKTERVRAAVAQLDFRPSRTARTLRRRSSEVIALIIPDVENTFFTALARGVEDRAVDAGYSVVLCNPDENPVKEDRYLDIAVAEQMAGVVLASASPEPDVMPLTSRETAVVLVDRSIPDPLVDLVVLDDEDAAARATRALYDRG